MILIITNKYDPHVDKVIDFLHEKKVVFMRFNTEDFPENIHFAWRNNASKIDGEIIFPSGKTALLSQVRACWYRKPDPPKTSPKLRSKLLKRFAEEESSFFLKELWIYLSDRFWINQPSKLSQASSKMYNLKLAEDIGLITPSTLITNMPNAAKQFYTDKKGDIINKVFGSGKYKAGKEYYLVFTHRVLPEDVGSIDNVQYSPTIFQKYIPKKVEIRTTIVGDKVFSCEIHSQDNEKTRDDWRNYGIEDVKHLEHKLPRKIEQQLLTMMKRLGINFGTFDLILTPDNEYIFLELNPNGQYLWIERLTGLPISRAIADLLIQHS